MARTIKKQTKEENDLKEVAREAARETFIKMQTEDDGPDDNTLSFIDASNDITEAPTKNDPTGFDIFADVGDPRTERGDIIRYVVRKWGQHIATKFHPYSWEELLEEFGQGNYQVIARSDNTKKFVKSESRILGDARNNNKKVVEETKEDNSFNQPHQQGLGFMELFTLLQEQQKQAKEEAREMSRDSQNTQNQMMMLVAELMKSNSTSGASSSVQMMQMITGMIQQQQQTANQIFEKLAENQSRMFEKINERIEKVQDKKTNEFEMFNKGIEMFSKMNELAEKKVQLRIEELEEAKEEARSEEGDTPKKKSMTDSLIEGILPVVSQALLANQQGPAFIAQQKQALQQQAQQAQRRRALQIAAARKNQSDRAIQTRTRVEKVGPTNKNETSSTPSTKKDQINFEGNGKIDRTNIVKRSGLPSAVVESYNDRVIDFSEDDNSEIDELVKFNENLSVKDKCNEILPEFFGRLMLENTDPLQASLLTLEFFDSNEISPDRFLDEVKIDDLLQVANNYGLPETSHQWLNEVYAHIQAKPRNVNRGKPDQSRQPEAPIGMVGQP